jgi:hypothetical protein
LIWLISACQLSLAREVFAWPVESAAAYEVRSYFTGLFQQAYFTGQLFSIENVSLLAFQLFRFLACQRFRMSAFLF